ncbi:hypothetical protein FLX07_29965 [Microbispora bryophytorum]|nr:hypothetical protein FLX07_29965 [Microbispora bryophytorum]
MIVSHHGSEIQDLLSDVPASGGIEHRYSADHVGPRIRLLRVLIRSDDCCLPVSATGACRHTPSYQAGAPPTRRLSNSTPGWSLVCGHGFPIAPASVPPAGALRPRRTCPPDVAGAPRWPPRRPRPPAPS